MSFVDTVPAEAMGTPQPGRGWDAADLAPARPNDAFASILAMTFRSSTHLDEMFARRGDPGLDYSDRKPPAGKAPTRGELDQADGRDRHASTDRASDRDDDGKDSEPSSGARWSEDDHSDDSLAPVSHARDEKSRTPRSDTEQSADPPPERGHPHEELVTAPSQDNRVGRATNAEKPAAASRPESAHTARSSQMHTEGPPTQATLTTPAPTGTPAGIIPNHVGAVAFGGQAGQAGRAIAVDGAIHAAQVGPTGSILAARAAQSTANKTLTTAARPASSPSDFLNVLQQVGRAAQPNTSLAMRGAGEPSPTSGERTFHLQRTGSMEEMARVLRSAVGGKHSSMTLQLDPPELGQLRIDVRMHEQTLSVRIEADTKAGYDAIRARIGELRQTLESQGVRLDQLDVQVRQPAHAADARGQDGTTSSWQEQGGGAAHQQVGDGSAFRDSRDNAAQSWEGDVPKSEASSEAATDQRPVILENDTAGLSVTGVDVTV